jgi:hypothetical protein
MCFGIRRNNFIKELHFVSTYYWELDSRINATTKTEHGNGLNAAPLTRIQTKSKKNLCRKKEKLLFALNISNIILSLIIHRITGFLDFGHRPVFIIPKMAYHVKEINIT